MGVVFEAFDRERGEPVALKTLREQDPEHLLRLKREFRALTDLSHPNLVALYDLFVGDETFFTMELIDGTEILDYCGDDPERLRAVLPQVARAIQALHDAGVVHQDIKSSNIMVTPTGRAVLLDFGVAAEIDPGIRDDHGAVVGTVDYMAPEQSAGERPGFPADWYSFGSLVYRALTGKMPFEGPPLEVMLKKLQQPPRPPAELRPGAPDDLASLAVDLLARAPGDRPTGEQVLRRLGVPQVVVSDTSSIVALPFVGRHAELSKLERHAAGLRDGCARVVLLEGDSGIGKSALVQQLCLRLRARHRDLVVLRGRCYERETVTYKALDGVMDDLSSYWRGLDDDEAEKLLPGDAALLPRLFPVLGRVPAVAMADRPGITGAPIEIRRRAIGELRDTLRRLAGPGELVVAIDDMQWVDPDSVQLLEDLVRPPDAPALLLICTARPRDVRGSAELDRLLDRLLGAAGEGSLSLALGPLPRDEARDLARALLPGEKADQAESVVRESRGNPFFIGQLASYLQIVESTSLQRIGLDQVLTARLRKLPDHARRLLQLIALAREPVPREVLARAAGMPLKDLATDLRLLRIARLTESGGTRRSDFVRPYHDRVASAVLDGIGDEHRRALHRRLAAALEEWHDVAPERLSRHWQGAGDPGKAAEHALRAAHEARGRFDFERAAALYQLALSLGSPDDPGARKLQILAAEMLVDAGRPTEAAAAFAAAARASEPADALELRRRAADQLLACGYPGKGLETLGGVLGEMGMQLAASPGRAMSAWRRHRWRLRLRGLRFRERGRADLPASELTRADACWTAATGLAGFDPARGAEMSARGLHLSLELGEPFRAARALALEAIYAAARAPDRRSAELADAARAAADRLSSRYLAGLVDLTSGLAERAACNWRRSTELLEQAIEAFSQQRERTAIWELDEAQLSWLATAIWLGDLDRASTRTESYLLAADRRGDRYLATCIRTRFGVLALAKGEPERALGESDAAIRDWQREQGSDDYHLLHAYTRQTHGEVALYTGRLDRAGEIMAETERLERARLDRFAMPRTEDLFLRGRLMLARALSRPAGSSESKPHLRAAARFARQLARRAHPAVAPALGRALGGAVCLERGDRDGAGRRLELALRDLDRLGCGLYGAGVRRVLGALIGGPRGDRLLAEAADWMSAQRIADPDRFAALLMPHRRSAL